MEELWFNNPDPYDLAETDRPDLQETDRPDLQETVIRSSTRFEIANYMKLDDSKLTALISNIDQMHHSRKRLLFKLNRLESLEIRNVSSRNVTYLITCWILPVTNRTIVTPLTYLIVTFSYVFCSLRVTSHHNCHISYHN